MSNRTRLREHGMDTPVTNPQTGETKPLCMWAMLNLVSPTTAVNRANRGWDLWDAVSRPPSTTRNGSKTSLVVFDGEHLTTADFARRIGAPYHFVRNRLRAGWLPREIDLSYRTGRPANRYERDLLRGGHALPDNPSSLVSERDTSGQPYVGRPPVLWVHGYTGEEHPIDDWIEYLGVSRPTLYSRRKKDVLRGAWTLCKWVPHPVYDAIVPDRVVDDPHPYAHPFKFLEWCDPLPDHWSEHPIQVFTTEPSDRGDGWVNVVYGTTRFPVRRPAGVPLDLDGGAAVPKPGDQDSQPGPDDALDFLLGRTPAPARPPRDPSAGSRGDLDTSGADGARTTNRLTHCGNHDEPDGDGRDTPPVDMFGNPL